MLEQKQIQSLATPFVWSPYTISGFLDEIHVHDEAGTIISDEPGDELVLESWVNWTGEHGAGNMFRGESGHWRDFGAVIMAEANNVPLFDEQYSP